MNYLLGFIFVILYTCFLIGIGYSLNSNKSLPFQYISGYIVFHAGTGVAGILVQVLSMNWSIYFWLETIWIFLLLVWIALRMLLQRRKSFQIDLKSVFSQYWFIVLVLGILMYFTLTNYPIYWLAGHLDDGFYLNKIALYPYVNGLRNEIAATGLGTTGKLDAYTINTFEIEASYFLYLLKIDPSLYCHFFLGIINWLAALSSIYVFTQTVCSLFGRVNQKWIQYSCAAALFLIINQFFLESSTISILEHGWQFAGCMYYGSAMVRSCGFILLLCPFIKNPSITGRKAVMFFITSFVLITRTTVALPMIIAAALVIVFMWMLRSKKYRLFVISFLAFALISIGLYFVCLKMNVQFAVDNSLQGYRMLREEFKTWLMAWMAFCSVLGILLRNKKLNYLILSVFLSAAVLCIPGLNTITAVSSVYDFVVNRTVTALILFGFYLSISILSAWLMKLNRKSIAAAGITVVLVSLIGLNISGVWHDGGSAIAGGNPASLLNQLRVYRQNPLLIPSATRNAGISLKRLTDEYDGVNVWAPIILETDGVEDYSMLLLRAYAPQIQNPAYNYRYFSSDPQYNSWTIDVSLLLNSYMETRDQTDFMEIMSIAETFSINTFILAGKEPFDDLQAYGYHLFDTIPDTYNNRNFYIYTSLQAS